ncbi:MAG: M17 family peptidase N-terminal domain-containing protein [bacterium]
MIQLKLSNAPVDEIDSQLALVTAFEDIRPLKGTAGLVDWRLNGRLSRLILDSRFSGSRGEALLMPTAGRLDARELLLVGMGNKTRIAEAEIPSILTMLVEKILMKKTVSFSLSLSDLIPGMFEWRNAVRLFVSMLSGRNEEMVITLVEDGAFIEDAKKRHMDFAYDVNVHYELM